MLWEVYFNRALRKKGYPIIEEVPKYFISRGYPDPRTKEFQIEYLAEQIKREKDLERLCKQEVVFLDRGVLDVLAYARHFFKEEVPGEIETFDFAERYDKIFLLERLPFNEEGFRIETGEEEAQEIHNTIISVCHEHGYNPISVPIMGKEERVNYILERIK